MEKEITKRLRDSIEKRENNLYRLFGMPLDNRNGDFDEIYLRIKLSDAEQILKDREKGEAEIKKLKFMIDNGLGWDDMKNDISPMHEI